ncbi:hypothetical protein TPA0909_11030 [Streptomyces albus]|nr:hypothetical protein TPA0909_11030 [Streptomyces albus]
MNTPGTAREHPQEWQPGEVVKDARTGRVGVVMDRLGSLYQVRPLNGGREWDVHPRHMVTAIQSDALSSRLAELNHRSSDSLGRTW